MYDITTVAGLKLAEAVSATLEQIDGAATLKELVNSVTHDGALPEKLEVGFAAKVVEFDMTGQSGNVPDGDTLTGGTSGATGVIKYQVDGGSVSAMIVEKVSGTFQEGETVTATSNSNTGTIANLVAAPGGGDGKYSGEVLFGVEAGSGATVYADVVAATDGLTALRDEYVKLFQGDF